MQRWRTAGWHVHQLPAETEITERRLAEMPMRRLLRVVKVSVAIFGVILVPKSHTSAHVIQCPIVFANSYCLLSITVTP